MITKDNLKTLLLSLNFEKNGDQYSKKFADSEAFLRVDFDKNLLIYPEDKGLIIHGRQTCNFSANILRQHNVSGRENAFDKLVNLFLCKLVDESQKQKNINVEILKPIEIHVPPLADQQRLVAEIEKLEQTIAKAKAIIAAASAKKQAIMQVYL
jgi:hypothetical protein